MTNNVLCDVILQMHAYIYVCEHILSQSCSLQTTTVRKNEHIHNLKVDNGTSSGIAAGMGVVVPPPDWVETYGNEGDASQNSWTGFASVAQDMFAKYLAHRRL